MTRLIEQSNQRMHSNDEPIISFILIVILLDFNDIAHLQTKVKYRRIDAE